jgi:predicted permease
MSIHRFFRRKAEHAEVAREIESHIAHEIDDNVARGMSEEEARRQAYIKFGNPQSAIEDVWEWNTAKVIDDLWRDLRYAARTLSRTPGFAIIAILIMALGIGANTALFTIVRSVLLKPLPFADPERLVMLYEVSGPHDYPYNVVAGGIFQEWQKQSHSFEQMAIWGGSGYNLSGTHGQLPEKVEGGKCSWNFFSTLGVQPVYGRAFSESEDSPNANGTVILSWSLWKRRFAGDPSVVGKDILLDGQRWTVIGVLPPWFNYPDPETQLWTPIRHETRPAVWNALGDHQFRVVARLRRGATLAQGLSEVDTIEKRLHNDHPDQTLGKGASIRRLLDEVVADYKTPLYILLAATGCFLLIACLNVANLLVARSAARRRELAIRTALGGTRWRLLREQLSESVVLAAIGGTLGVAFAWLAVQWVIRVRHDIPRAETIHIDASVLSFAIAITLLSGIAAGLLPALSASGTRILEALQESSRAHSGGQRRAQLRRVLLSLEVALTVMLMIAAGLLLKSYERLRSSDLGCDTENVLTMRISLPKPHYAQEQSRAAFFEELIARVRSLPGVQQAALTTTIPGQGYGGDSPFSIVEHPPLLPGKFQLAIWRGVDPGYFSALSIPVLRGRSFTDAERLDHANVVIISNLTAKRYFPDEDPIGKHLRVPIPGHDGSYEIIGVAGDTRVRIFRPPEPMMYFPLYSGIFGGVSIAVRSQQDVNSLALPIQKLIAQMDPDLPVSDVLTMEQMIGSSTINASFTASLVLGFAMLSLFLASIGLYGVLSYLVTQRTGEIGIRIALGAERMQVLRLVLIDGLRPAVLGLVFGLAGGALATRWIRSMLYGVQPLDQSVFVVVTALLSLVAIAGCLVPAWQASRVNPMEALRSE